MKNRQNQKSKRNTHKYKEHIVHMRRTCSFSKHGGVGGDYW